MNFGLPGRALLAVGAVAAMVALSVAPANARAIPGVDEVVTSPNVTHLANNPKQPPFDLPGAFGTDIAFKGDYAFVGNYSGFTIYNIKHPHKPELVSQVLCPGAQNDVSVAGDLLFLSTDSSRNNDSCNSVGQSPTIKESWEGIKIFDVSDKRNPTYVKSVETNCGSHTHTLVPDRGRRNVYVYVSSYFPADNFPDCTPPHDKISIIKVPLNNPAAAAVVATPVLFPEGGNPGGGSTWFPTTGCHDITAYPEKDLAAGACMGDGVLMDISNREAPKVIETVRDTVNFAFWHSATLSNGGNKVVFTDELGGGGAATCNEATGPTRGANAIYDVTRDKKLVFGSYFKISRHQANTENCVAHNGSLIPVPGRDIMVQSWYQGGVQVWDFTDSAHPKEIGFFERGPLSDTQFVLGGTWSAYWYNGHIYSSDIIKGLDVLRVNDHRINIARHLRVNELNAQTQYHYPDWR